MNIIIIILLTIIYLNTNTGNANNIKITDGDTIRINKERIRLWGIDAPELQQKCYTKKNNTIWPCGKKAQEFLSQLINNNEPKCTTVHKDKYNRTVSRCKITISKDNSPPYEIDLNSQMIRNGWALDYTHYSHGQYMAEQEKAKIEEKGIWTSNFEFPWEWRKHKN